MESLEKFIDSVVQPLLKSKSGLPNEVQLVIEKNKTLNISEITYYYNKCHEHIGKNNDFKVLIKALWLFQVLILDIIPTNFQLFLLDCIRQVPFPEEVKVKVIESVINKILTEVSQDQVDFTIILGLYSFILNIEKNLNHNTATERAYITSIAKCLILSNIKDLNEITTGLNYILKADAAKLPISSSKFILASQAINWIKDHKSSDNKELIKTLRSLELDQELSKELDDIVKGTDSKPVNEGLNKITSKYSLINDTIHINVWECTKAGYNHRIAAKICRSRSEKDLQSFFSEAKILQTLSKKTKNFLEYYDSYLTQETILGENFYVFTIEMEYVERTLREDKQKRLNENNPYSEQELMYIFCQLLSAYAYLQTMKIMHCDIKPSNIMINNDSTIKIIDFNVSKTLSEITMFGNAVGSLDYMAPEVRKGVGSEGSAVYKYDKSDVFSLGMTLLFLITTESLANLNQEQNKNELNRLISRIPFDCFKGVLTAMLDFNPNSRPSLKDLVSDPNPTLSN
jgi:Protein kinase domain